MPCHPLLLVAQHCSHCRRPGPPFAVGCIRSLVGALGPWLGAAGELCHDTHPGSGCTTHFRLPKFGPFLFGPSHPWRKHLPRVHLNPLLCLQGSHLVLHHCCRARASSSRFRSHLKAFRGNTWQPAPMHSTTVRAVSPLLTGVSRVLLIHLKGCGKPFCISA